MRKHSKQKENLKQVGELQSVAGENLAKTPGAPTEMKDKTKDEVIGILKNQQIDLEKQNKELMKTKLALEESNEKYRVLFEMFPLGISITDAGGKLIETNKESERLLGISRDEHNRRNYYGPEWKIIRLDGTPMPPDEYASVRALKENRRVENVEIGIVKGEGEVTWINVNSAPIPLDNYGVVITYGDITESMGVLDELKKSTKLLRDTGEMAMVGGWVLDLATGEVSWSEETCRIHGVEPGYKAKLEEAVNFYAPESRPALEAVLKKAMETGEPYDLESLFIPSGSKEKIYVRSLGRAVYSGGKIVKLNGTFQNIDKYKRAQEAQRESKDAYRALVENINEVIYTLDLKGKFTYVSPVVERISGYGVNDLYGKDFTDFIHPDDLPGLIESFGRTMKGDIEPYEYRILDRDGSIRYIRTSSRLIYGGDAVTGITGVMTDITERKRVEEEMRQMNDQLVAANARLQEIMKNQERSRLALLSILEDEHLARKVVRESEKKYRTLIETTPCVICTIKPDGTTVFVNSYVKVVTGYAAEELIGRNWFDVFYPGGLYGQIRVLLETFKSRDVHEYEMTLKARDGSFKNLQWDSFNKYGTNNEIIEINGVGIDITDRKRAENELKINYDIQRVLNDLLHVSLQKEHLDVMLQKSLEMLFSIDWLAIQSRGMILLADETQMTLTLAARYGIGNGLPVVHQAALPFGSCLCGIAAETRDIVFAERVDDRHTVRYEGMAPHGHYCVPILHEGTVLGVLNLYTEEGHRYDPHEADFLKSVTATLAGTIIRKRAEDRLEEMFTNLERMVADRTFDLEKANKDLESFSYTVSHDLRAPLRHINGFLEMFRREIGEIKNEKALHYMDVINDSARRMGLLIDDLLAFSRMGRTELSMHTVDMEKLSDEVLAGFSEEIGSRAVDVARGPLPPVMGDRAMLRVVLTNLVSNAVKFTSRTAKGKIEIGHDMSDGESVFFVKDNGAGFDMRFSDKLFGVFQRLHSDRDFEGTGIGLATVKSIIQRHGGRVWAEGEVGRGACFYFTVPMEGG